MNDHLSQSTFAFHEFLDSFEQFLIVLINNVLFLKELYPLHSFESYTIYSLKVSMCRHPMVMEWVRNLAKSCIEHLSKGRLSKFIFLILSDDNTPIESFVINIDGLPKDLNSFQDEKFSWATLKEEYRSCLVSFELESRNHSEQPSSQHQFTVLIETDQITSESLNTEWVSIRQETGEKSGKAKISPICVVDAGPFSFNIWKEKYH